MDAAIAPVTVTGWRVWDLHVGARLFPAWLTRGIVVVLDRDSRFLADGSKQVAERELAVMLESFGGYPLAFHVCTHAGEAQVPDLLELLLQRFPRLDGRTLQINKKLSPDTCSRLLTLKEQHRLRVILQHFNLLSAQPGDAVVQLADQVLFDLGGGRGKVQLALDERTLALLEGLAQVTPAPIGLAGRLNAQRIHELDPHLQKLRQRLHRPLALDAESQMRSGGGLDLDLVREFAEACRCALELDPTVAER